MLRACREGPQKTLLAFLLGVLSARLISRFGDGGNRSDQGEDDRRRKRPLHVRFERLVKRGSFLFAGRSKSDSSEASLTPGSLNEPQQDYNHGPGSDLPIIRVIKDGGEVASCPKSAFEYVPETCHTPFNAPAFPLDSPFGSSANGSPQIMTRPKLAVARAMSGIPSDINVPELVFGHRIVPAERPKMVPFSVYAPCRILDVSPEGKENSHLFEAMKTIATSFLQADNGAIADSIQKYSLNDMLYGIARLEISLREPLQPGWQPDGMKPYKYTKRKMSRWAMQKAAEAVIYGSEELGPKGVQEAEAAKAVVSSFMNELECILHEYLSFNWDKADEIYSVNQGAQFSSFSRRNRSELLTNTLSQPILEGLSPLCGRSPIMSRNQSGWTDVAASNRDKDQQPVSPSSVTDSVHSTLETFDEYLANLPNSQNIQAAKSQPSESFGNDLGLNGAISSLRIESPFESSEESIVPDLEPRHRLSHEEFFGREPKRRMSLAVSDPALSSKAHRYCQRMNGKRSISDIPPLFMDVSEKAEKELHQTTESARRRAVRNWKRAKEAATRQVTKDMLGHHKRLLTLKQMFRALSQTNLNTYTQRQPVILLLGGGMAAGKSTVREIIGQDGFWSKVGKDSVVVEADAIKNSDALYASMSRVNIVDMLDSDNDLKQHLHEYSTKAAELLLVAAVNQQKDVVFDGTMTWAPFVEQTIAMVRDHQHNYKRGPGFVVDVHGTGTEKYWEVDEDSTVDVSKKIPYRIELVGVTCDPGLAVARGVWRKIRTGRSVPVEAQLRSHRLFSENFEAFSSLVDCSTLYDTGCALTTFNKGDIDLSPQVIAHRSSYTRGELLIHPAAYQNFKRKSDINDQAVCRADLYSFDNGPGSIRTIPTTLEDEDSPLRHVFRAADKKQRREKAGRDAHSIDILAL